MDICITNAIDRIIHGEQRFNTEEDGFKEKLSHFLYESGIEVEEYLFEQLLNKTHLEQRDYTEIDVEVAVHTTITFGDYYGKKHLHGNGYIVSHHQVKSSNQKEYLASLEKVKYDFHNHVMEELELLFQYST